MHIINCKNTTLQAEYAWRINGTTSVLYEITTGEVFAYIQKSAAELFSANNTEYISLDFAMQAVEKRILIRKQCDAN